MSLFSIYEPFSETVKNQLEIRRAILSTNLGVDRKTDPEDPENVTTEYFIKDKDEDFYSSPTSSIFLNRGDTPEHFYAYTTEKRCTIRMVSGVDLKKEANDDFLETHEKNKKLKDGLARQFILEGGTRYYSSDGLLDGLREGFTTLSEEDDKTRGFSYGDKNLRSNPEDDFGIVPMPGIVDATIETKSKEGALREAVVNFSCHNRRQLEVLEALYMRPGYHILLEWGWTPHIDNDGEISNSVYSIIDEFFDGNNDLDKLQQEIRTHKKDSGGNYDGFIGICKNFTIKAREDGGYDCQTEIMAQGEIMESLKTKKIVVDAPIEGQQLFQSKEISDTLLYYLRAIKYSFLTEVMSNDSDSPFNYLLLPPEELPSDRTGDESSYVNQPHPERDLTDGNNNGIPDEDEFSDEWRARERISSSTNWYNYMKGWFEIQDLWYNKITKQNKNEESSNQWDKLGGIGYVPFLDGALIGQVLKVNYEGDDEDYYDPYDFEKHMFVRWDLVCHIINRLCTEEYKKDKPVVELSFLNNGSRTFSSENEINSGSNIFNEKSHYISYGAPNNIETSDPAKMPKNSEKDFHELLGQSFDFSIGILPHMKIVQDVSLDEGQTDILENETYGKRIKGNGTSFSDVEFTNNSIGHIYFNINYLIKEYEQMRFKSVKSENKEDTIVKKLNKDFSLYKYLKQIWEGMNDACANYYKFDITTEHERSHIVKVIDKNFSSDVRKEEIFEFKPQGLESISRNFVFDSSISRDFASVVSIAAQSPKNEFSLEAVSFQAFHKNIENRFTTSEFSTKDLQAQKDEAIEILQIDVNEYLDQIAQLKKYFVALQHSSFYVNEEGDESPFINANTAKIYAESIDELRISILNRFPLLDLNGEQHPKAGLYRPDTTHNRSAIIPLQFNIQLDGISGILPYQVFKIQPERLPKGYQRDDICFITFKESQKIESNGDWVVEITGQLTLLNTENRNNDGFQDEDQMIQRGNKIDKINKEVWGETTPKLRNRTQSQIDVYNPNVALANLLMDSVAPKNEYYFTNPIQHDVVLSKNPDGAWGYERQDNTDRHRGVDLAPKVKGKSGDPIIAPYIARVEKAVPDGKDKCGGEIILDHGLNVKTRYCHLRKINVEEGDLVQRYDIIGEMGGAEGDKGRGSATNTHLHYELWNLRDLPDWWHTTSISAEVRNTSTGDPMWILSPKLSINKPPVTNPGSNFPIDPGAPGNN
jgi:murein DD-endopeptidase MepM/ murein hydrolase activator NlpD